MPAREACWYLVAYAAFSCLQTFLSEYTQKPSMHTMSRLAQFLDATASAATSTLMLGTRSPVETNDVITSQQNPFSCVCVGERERDRKRDELCDLSQASWVLLSQVADGAGSPIFLLRLFLASPRLAWHNGSWISDITFHKLSSFPAIVFKTVRETGRRCRVRGLQGENCANAIASFLPHLDLDL